jgi:hypothetical protein
MQASYTSGSELLYLNITSNHWNYTTYSNVSTTLTSSLSSALGYMLSFG